MITNFTLTVVEGPHQGAELNCAERKHITIGRSDECSLHLRGAYEDLLISRRHCLIVLHADWVEIRDLESLNGTFVNEQRLGFPIGNSSTAFKRRLRDGDRIRIGTTVLQVSLCEVEQVDNSFDSAEQGERSLVTR
jgi:pSer/pThr/pTyr-binding forkhead associated (FHA) protein